MVTTSGTYQLATIDMELIREVTYLTTYETGVDEFGFEWHEGHDDPLDQATRDAQVLADERGEPIAIVDPHADDAPIVEIVEPRKTRT